MHYTKHYFALRDFEYFKEHDIDILNYVKQELLIKMYSEKMTEDNLNYIISFKKEYWNERKIINECERYAPYPKFKFSDMEFNNMQELIDYVKEKVKPFDLILVLKSNKEYEWELNWNIRFKNEFDIDNAEMLDDNQRNDLMQQYYNLHPMQRIVDRGR